MSDIATLFHKLTAGVYVVGVTDGSTRDAFTAASVSHVSYQPLLVSLAINPAHASYRLLLAGKAWTISVLRSDQIELARRFGAEPRPGTDKMNGITWSTAASGAPFLEQALAYFDCRLAAEYPAGDHRIVLGLVKGGDVLTSELQDKPMVYADTGDLDQSAALFPANF
jgi:flavin reductase (DIM6/NTAB) family NADH-FMN oxidoreductase RutF